MPLLSSSQDRARVASRASAALAPAVLALLLALLTSAPAQAISSRILIAPTGVGTSDFFGSAVAGGFDFNGDGHLDVLVGAPANNTGGTDRGQAYVFLGGPGADAVADVTFTGTFNIGQFGFALANAGDVNNDGFDDIVIGAPFTTNGDAFLFLGGSPPNNVADLTFTGLAAGDQLGYSVAGAGDVNQDGYDDLLIGAPFHEGGGTNRGQAYVFLGGSTPNNVSDLTLSGFANDDHFGSAVASAGDMNVDGFADMVVGAPENGAADRGAAYLFFGGVSLNSVSDMTFLGADDDGRLGRAVASAGDMDGPNAALFTGPDLLIATPRGTVVGPGFFAGYVGFHRGGENFDNNADEDFNAEDVEEFGTSIAAAGDIDGDGFDDIVIGGPLYNREGAVDAGRVGVYFGEPAPVDVGEDLRLTGFVADDRFGSAVAGAGDIDGDGFRDLIVGAPRSDGSVMNAGQAYVILIYPYQVVAPNGGEVWPAGQPVTVRWRGRDVADLALSTDGGNTWSTIAAGVGGEDENEWTFTAPGPATGLAKVRLSYSGQDVTRSRSDQSDGVFRIVIPEEPPPAASRLQWTADGELDEDQLGWWISTAGDVNGDGYADVIAGAPFNDAVAASAGRAYLYFGGPSSDGVADLTLSGELADDNFGSSAAGAGDLNADGFDDWVVGAPFDDNASGADAGRAYVYVGGATPDATADLTIDGAAANDQYATAVAHGDVNGDGFEDLIVGALFNDAGAAEGGAVYVYFGSPVLVGGADLTLTGKFPGDRFGFVVGAGDVNADGFDDVIVGAPRHDARGAESGRVYVYLGGPIPDAIADFVLDGESQGDQLGSFVASGGDVNGDAIEDIAVGARFHDAAGLDAGAAYVYFGGTPLDAVADLRVTGERAGDQFGTYLDLAGDANGDGHADLLVAGINNDAGGPSAGRTYLYYGGAAADGVPDLVLTGEADGDLLGSAVAIAGDVNGDDHDDLFVAAQLNDGAGINAGRLYLYDLNRYHLLAPNGGEIWDVGAVQTVSWLGAAPADLWLSADAGATFELLRSGVGGEASNVVSLTVPHLPTRFAVVRVAPSDPSLGGRDQSAARFTIRTDVSLLSLVAQLEDEGVRLEWSTEPAVGPEGLRGYRLYRQRPGEAPQGTRVGPDLILENHYTDTDGAPGSTYRLLSVNGHGLEIELGRVTAGAVLRGVAAWPNPARAGTALSVAFAAPLGNAGFPASDLEVALFDAAGRRVAVLARGQVADRGGVVRMEWLTRTDDGRPLPAGVYLVRALAPSAGFRAERKVVLLP
ncbi:MAG: integrin alpha [Candidatus Eiseniibacteriota bacterium]